MIKSKLPPTPWPETEKVKYSNQREASDFFASQKVPSWISTLRPG